MVKNLTLILTTTALFLTSCQIPNIIPSKPTATATIVPTTPTPAVFKSNISQTLNFEVYPIQKAKNPAKGTAIFTINEVKELTQINQSKPRPKKKFILVLFTVQGNSKNQPTTDVAYGNSFRIFQYYLTNGTNGFANIKREEDFLAKEYKAKPYINLKLTEATPQKTFAVFELEQTFPVKQFVIGWMGKNNIFQQQAMDLI